MVSLTKEQWKARAIRCTALAITAHTTEGWMRWNAYAREAAKAGGVTACEDDPEVLRLVQAYNESERQG